MAWAKTLMYELDDSKYQVMTVLKLALANLAMWVRDNYFPPAYEHATWNRLAPFLRLPGRVAWGPDTVRVEMRPFNDRGLNRDLQAICGSVAEAKPRMPDGRKLTLTGEPAGVAKPEASERSVA